MANPTQQFIDDLNGFFQDAGIKGRIPSIEEIKRQDEVRNQKAQSRNESIVAGAIGKEIAVKEKGTNVTYRGTIISAELTGNGQAKIMIESQGRTNPQFKVKRGPFFVSKLPR